MGKRIAHSFGHRVAPLIGALLPFLLLLVLLPEPFDSPEVDDYLPASRARGVSIQPSKSLKSFSGERVGSTGADIALSVPAHDWFPFRASVLADSPLHLQTFALFSRWSARSPPSLPL